MREASTETLAARPARVSAPWLLFWILSAAVLAVAIPFAPELAAVSVCLFVVYLVLVVVERVARDPFAPLLFFGSLYIIYNGIGLLQVPGTIGVMGLPVVPHRGTLILYYVIGLVGFCSGIGLASMCWPKSQKTGREAAADPQSGGHFQAPWNTKRTVLVGLAYLIVGGLAEIYTFYMSGWTIPLVSGDIERSRFAMARTGYTGYVSLFISLLPAAAMILTPQVLLARSLKHIEKRVTFFVLLVGCLGLMVLLANRSILYWGIVPALIAYHYSGQRIRLPRLAVAAGGLVASMRVFDVLRYFGFQQGLVSFFKGMDLWEQFIFFVYQQPRATVETFGVFLDAIPSKVPYYLGRLTLTDWSTALPGHHDDASTVTMYITESVAGRFAAPSARPPGLVGAYYSEFGVPGIFVGMLILGFILQWFYKRVQTTRDSRSAILYGWLLSFAVLGLYGLGLPQLASAWLLALVILGVDCCSGAVSWLTYLCGAGTLFVFFVGLTRVIVQL